MLRRSTRYHDAVKGGTHTFLPTGSLEKIEEEARSSDRAFVVTGRSLYEKTDLIRHVEALLGEFYRRGVREVGLSVDAESTTGAPRLYGRAGTCPWQTGRDLSSTTMLR